MLHCPQCGQTYAGDVTICPADGASLRADQTVAFAPRDPLAGVVLDGKYRLDARLGEGGMGTVYRATHLLIERPVAVKVLHARFVEDGAAQERFRREARAAGRLQHPNAVAVTDFGSTADGHVYIVMELLEGRTLRDVLATEAPLAVGRAVGLMSQAAAAVGAAHEAGVIHRDLKPGNIFVVQRADSPPVVKVLDFGIAKLAAEPSDDSDARNLTQTGVMIGTPRYMSPEQCDGDRLTPASDVYGLGIILYEMLTGATPFNGATPLAVALQHSSKPPRPPRELVPTIPLEFERVVLHSLAKRPEERPADANEFRRELLETARALGLETGLGASAALASHAGPAPANGDGKSHSDKLVVDLERMRAAHAAAARDGRAPTNETTVLADTGELSRLVSAANSGAGASASPSAPAVANQGAAGAAGSAASAGGAIAALSQLREHSFTRFRVLLQKRRPWLYWLSQPPVLIAALMAVLVLAVAVAGFVKSRGASEAAALPAANANAAEAAATPTPEATPAPSPSPGDEAAKQAARRRAQRPANQRPQKKSGNRVKRALKKIFNPF